MYSAYRETRIEGRVILKLSNKRESGNYCKQFADISGHDEHELDHQIPGEELDRHGSFRAANVSVTISHDNQDVTYTNDDGTFSQITWDPHYAHQTFTQDGSSGIQSPALAFAHEIAHAVYHADEAAATAFENRVAMELGEPTRYQYNANSPVKVYVENPTEHTENGTFIQMNLDGTYTSGGSYTGSTVAYPLGWGMGASGGGGGGGMFQTVGGIDIIGSTQPTVKKDASYWKNVNYSDNNSEPASPHDNGHQHSDDIGIVAVIGQPLPLGPEHF